MALSDTTIRNAKPKDRQFKLFDEGGLFLIVSPAGGKWWRLKYRVNGREQQLTIGVYPDIGLKEARSKRDEARRLIAASIDPGAEKKRKAAAATIAAENTFASVAEEFIAKREQEGLADVTVGKTKWLLSLLAPGIGKRPVSEIEPYELLAVLKEIETRGTHETAKRMRAFAARVFRYAIITGRARHNPAADLGEALISPKVKHHAAIIEPKAVGALLRAIDGYDGNSTTKIALRLAPHVFARPGMLRQAEWTEVDFEAAVWRIPAPKMKMREEHVVPLSTQALKLFKEAEVVRGHSKWI